MITPGSQKCQNALTLSKNSNILGLSCKSLVAGCKFTFVGWTGASCFINVKKLWQIIDGVFCIPRVAVCRVKKPKQNSVKSRKNDFVETNLLNLFKSCVLLLQFLKIFLFSFMFSTTLLSYKQKCRAER